MTMKIIDGKKIAKAIRLQVRKAIVESGLTPGLAVFLIGHDEASELYVKLKEKACKEVGIDFHKYLCEDNTCAADIKEAINFINADDHVQAILLQLPLPDDLDEQDLINSIDSKKDVDGFHPETLKHYLDGKSDFMPGLTMGILRLIESTGETLKAKQAVILANSKVFALPLEKALTDKGISVQILYGPKLPAGFKRITSTADILITALGKPKTIKGDMIKAGSILIDVGTTKMDSGLVGDIDAEDVSDKAAYLTPVPGGVGPVTVAMLLENTFNLANKQKNEA